MNFTCNAGYTLVGSQTIECRSGRWSSNSPHCKSKLCFHYHHRRTGRGGLQPPQILGNKRKFGQSQVLKTFRCFFYCYFEEINILFYSHKNPDVGRRNNQVTFSRDIGCLARDEFLVIRKGYHTLIYIFIVF